MVGKRCCWGDGWIYMRVWIFACAACWPSARATYLAVSLVVTPSRPSSHSRSKSNHFRFRWLLLKGVWPFCMWPFLDFSLSSSPSSSDSVSSLSLRSSWTMSCQQRKQKKQDLHRDCSQGRDSGVEGNLKSGASYVAWQEFDNHSQNEPGPEDLQNLQHTHQAVEEVEPEEGPVEGQGVHQRRVNDPGKRTKSSEPIGSTQSSITVQFQQHASIQN